MQRRQAFSFSQLARQQAGFLRFFPGQPFIIKIARFPEQYFISLAQLAVYSAKISVLLQRIRHSTAYNKCKD
jgi:hypothetical protein